MDAIVTEDKPDLEKKSETFALIKGTALGAAIGAGLSAAYIAIPAVRESMGFSGYKEAAKKMVPVVTAVTGLASGWGHSIQARVENEQKDKIRPYVEKLEADRNRLADIALNGGSTQRS